ncbi:fungal cellulose binding domain-containing protein [Lindgomyces ingoldianus]|uniref:Fungal cellulose binding domain-containing protein n=1 Tax=Lindgomyces ingoldianus TaxID=673940 RepID=A0ACB6QG69_9PLEO|nr:fungal cellulose binding domain-containing protein [Lindgomyces ingoldianus]KAF2465112.1 fungal cellulose binding domain-containing protein [Lindgomyces ingoldianus]
MKFLSIVAIEGLVLASSLFNVVQAASAGCGKAAKLKAGTNTMTVNSKTRDWILTLPDNYNNTKPYRLIFGIHWLTGTSSDVANGGSIQPYYGLPPLANNTAIFVSPNGLKSGGSTGWANSNGEDITFIQEIVKAVEADYCVNEKLRFSMGFSYGAGMSYSIACTLGKDFRAVAALSGALLSGCVGGTDPVAYYGQHGLSDSVLPIASGRQLRDTFVKNNGCTPQSPPEPTKGSKTHIRTVYSGCASDKPVWWTAFDGDHTPIQADNTGPNKDTTFTGKSVWEFFSQFS